MIDHYNAFISYKHGDPDSKIAERVQRKLEHFHIPHRIAKNTSVKKISRIFRDKEELPITSNLTDTISHALEVSDYLIVICSTNTRKSLWVKREINYFLEHHSRDRILTVLCDGEPGDVIPEELLFEEQEVIDEDGNSHKVKIPLEPLSCDYRLKPGLADKEELPRLAAPIIGCSYDELTRRARQYKIRRLTLLFTTLLLLAAAFIVYAVDRNRRIRENYMDSLRSKAVYLASESEKKLEENDRITAMQLALAALPEDENDDMPVTVEAVRALTKATLAYKSNQGMSQVSSVWNYSMPFEITDFKTDPEGDFLCAKDKQGNLVCWRVKDHKELYRTDGDPGFFFTGDGLLVVIDTQKVSAISLETGKSEWNKNDLTVSKYLFASGKDRIVLKDGAHDQLLLLDSKNGKVLSKIDHKFDIMQTEKMYELSPDGKKLAIVSLDLEDTIVHLFMVDMETGTQKSADYEYMYCSDMIWDEDHVILALTNESTASHSLYVEVAEESAHLACVSSEDLEVLWEQDFGFYSDSDLSKGLLALPERDAFAFFAGNRYDIFSAEDGSALNDFNVNDMILTISDSSENGYPLAITKDGRVVFPYTDDSNKVWYLQGLNDGLVRAGIGKGIFTCQRGSNNIVCYKFNVYDEEERFTEENICYSGIAQIFCFEGCVVIHYDVDDGTSKLIVYDPADEKIEAEVSLGFDARTDVCMIKSGDHCYIGRSDTEPGKCFVLDIDLKTGEQEEILTINENMSSVKLKGDFDLFWYMERDGENNTVLHSFDPDTKETKEYSKASVSVIEFRDFMIMGDDTNAIINGYGCAYEYDIAKDELKEIGLPEGFDGITDIEKTPEQNVISNGTDIVVTDKKWNEIKTLDLHGMLPKGYAYNEGKLYVMSDIGFLMEYDAESWELLRMEELRSDLLLYYNNSLYGYNFDFEDDQLILSNNYGMDLIDLTDLNTNATVPNFFFYDKEKDRFYISSRDENNDYRIGYFEHYDTEDLIKKARDYLDGAELSEADRSRYGI